MTLATSGARAQAPAPDAFIKQLSDKVMQQIRGDAALKAGDMRRIETFVEQTIMPHVNFERMTALAVGRGWRDASPQQREQLMKEFRTLLIRTYAGALQAVDDQEVRLRPLRAAPGDTDVIVRTEIVQRRGEPIQLDYRLEKTSDGWKIYDLNVLGVWLIETYRTQFAQEISAGGVDGLIRSLRARNEQFRR
ncbi:MAG TPA: ABC transporter substrate-binding protein [Burkholderiaceae bacterium]|nr:ABC transporter substrate-binding protein [Burkholderiaceae bacterium]